LSERAQRRLDHYENAKNENVSNRGHRARTQMDNVQSNSEELDKQDCTAREWGKRKEDEKLGR